MLYSLSRINQYQLSHSAVCSFNKFAQKSGIVKLTATGHNAYQWRKNTTDCTIVVKTADWCALHVDATYLVKASTHLVSSHLQIVYAIYDSSYDNHPLSQKLDPRLYLADLRSVRLTFTENRATIIAVIRIFKITFCLTMSFIPLFLCFSERATKIYSIWCL